MTEPDETKTLLDNEHNPSEEIIVIGKFSSVAEEFETDEDRGGGVWKDGICHCCNGVLPFLFAIFCGECYVAQMYQKEIEEEYGPGKGPLGKCGTCRAISCVFITLSVFGFLFSLCGETGQAIYGLLTLVQGICFFALVFFVRQVIRRKYGIYPLRAFCWTACCASIPDKAIFEDLLCSIFCSCCALGQMGRQIYYYRETGSSCASGGCRFTETGDPREGYHAVDIPPHILKARRELGGDPEGRQMLFWMAPEAPTRKQAVNAPAKSKLSAAQLVAYKAAEDNRLHLQEDPSGTTKEVSWEGDQQDRKSVV